MQETVGFLISNLLLVTRGSPGATPERELSLVVLRVRRVRNASRRCGVCRCSLPCSTQHASRRLSRLGRSGQTQGKQRKVCRGDCSLPEGYCRCADAYLCCR